MQTALTMETKPDVKTYRDLGGRLKIGVPISPRVGLIAKMRKRKDKSTPFRLFARPGESKLTIRYTGNALRKLRGGGRHLFSTRNPREA